MHTGAVMQCGTAVRWCGALEMPAAGTFMGDTSPSAAQQDAMMAWCASAVDAPPPDSDIAAALPQSPAGQSDASLTKDAADKALDSPTFQTDEFRMQ